MHTKIGVRKSNEGGNYSVSVWGVTNFSVCSSVESRDGAGWLEVPGAGLAHLGRDAVSTQWNQPLNPPHCLSHTICGEHNIH